ncbi:MAG: hypothetical protein L0Y44_10850 [Phycisphaerales bacterium]|nr:hypothetical protein [Terriglobales bacterium]MCI0631136.1 hypothetical protein [Phycisphaerales bacterium]MCI0677193.1 hypothetical protein [Phycisphaerales bacterium]
MTLKFPALAVGFCSLSLMIPALAQDKAPSPPPGRQDRPAPNQIDLINLDFPGGTVPQYIQAIRKASDDVNIVVLVDFSNVSMPPVQLRDVDPWSALLVLDSIPSYQGGRTVKIDVSNSFQQRADFVAGNERPVFTVNGVVTSGGSRNDPTESAVLEISELLGGEVKDADVLTAVQTALELLPDDLEPAKIKFHEATGLLIVHGHPEQVRSVKNVISQLQERMSRQQHRLTERRQVEQAASTAGETNAKLQDALTRVFELETRNGALHDENQRIERQLMEREATLVDCRAELEACKQFRQQSGKPN